MELTLADYLRQHPPELDEKSIALSETTAFTTYFERVWYKYGKIVKYFIQSTTGPSIGEGHDSRWSLSTGNFW